MLSRRFRKEFDALDTALKDRVRARLRLLAGHFDAAHHERLTGRPEFKLRVGDWRVLYDLDRAQRQILLLTVRHRREVYR